MEHLQTLMNTDFGALLENEIFLGMAAAILMTSALGFLGFLFLTPLKIVFIKWPHQIFMRWCTVVIHVDQSSAYLKPLMSFIAEWPSAKKKRSFRLIHTTAYHPSFTTSNNSAYADDGVDAKSAFSASLGAGKHLLWYKGRLWMMTIAINTDSATQKEELYLRTIAFSSLPFQKLVGDLIEWMTVEKRTAIYKAYEHGWSNSGHKEPRALDTLFYNDGVLESVLDDVEQWKNSKEWYHKRGIPYRRGFLFHGPAGTGKTSLVMTIAKMLDGDVYIIEPKDFGRMSSLIDDLSKNSVLLIEDVDTASVVAKRTEKAQESTSSIDVTLSEILNSLDGVSTPENYVVIMTTNHIDKIDPALIRPGRIDRKVPMEELSENVAIRMVEAFFEKPAGSIDALKVGEYEKMTPANIQEACFEARGDFSKAVKDIWSN